MTSVADRSVPFFTPIHSADFPLTKVIDHYLWFGGKVAVALNPKQVEEGSIATHEADKQTSMVKTVLKIATMILSLGILPLLALALKAIIRCNYHFHFVAPVAPMPPGGPTAPPSASALDSENWDFEEEELDQEALDRAIDISLTDQAPPAVRPNEQRPPLAAPLPVQNHPDALFAQDLASAVALSLAQPRPVVVPAPMIQNPPARPLAAPRVEQNHQVAPVRVPALPPLPRAMFRQENVSEILRQVPGWFDELDRINNDIARVLQTGRSPDELLVQQEMINGNLETLALIPNAQIATHYAQLRVTRSRDEGLQLEEVPAAGLFAYYRHLDHVNFQDLHHVDLIRKLERCGEREIELARSAIARAERELLDQEHAEADLAEAIAASAAEVPAPVEQLAEAPELVEELVEAPNPPLPAEPVAAVVEAAPRLSQSELLARRAALFSRNAAQVHPHAAPLSVEAPVEVAVEAAPAVAVLPEDPIVIEQPPSAAAERERSPLREAADAIRAAHLARVAARAQAASSLVEVVEAPVIAAVDDIEPEAEAAPIAAEPVAEVPLTKEQLRAKRAEALARKR